MNHNVNPMKRYEYFRSRFWTSYHLLVSSLTILLVRILETEPWIKFVFLSLAPHYTRSFWKHSAIIYSVDLLFMRSYGDQFLNPKSTFLVGSLIFQELHF